MDVPELCEQYEQHVETVGQLPLPAHRIDSLVAETEAVRETLATDGAVSATTLQTLLCVIAEAMGDVEHATASPTAARGAAQDGESNEMTPDEQATCLDALSQLQFAVVETPVGSD